MNDLRFSCARLFFHAFLLLAGVFTGVAMAGGIQVEVEGMDEIGRSVQKGHAEVRRIDEAYKAEREARRRESAGSNYGAINCGYVGKDYGLYKYCDTGSCDGFYDSYGLRRLCTDNDPSGLVNQYALVNYINNGNYYSFTGNARVSAEKHAGSFESRKRFAIYYLRGYVIRAN